MRKGNNALLINIYVYDYSKGLVQIVNQLTDYNVVYTLFISLTLYINIDQAKPLVNLYFVIATAMRLPLPLLIQ